MAVESGTKSNHPHGSRRSPQILQNQTQPRAVSTQDPTHGFASPRGIHSPIYIKSSINFLKDSQCDDLNEEVDETDPQPTLPSFSRAQIAVRSTTTTTTTAAAAAAKSRTRMLTIEPRVLFGRQSFISLAQPQKLYPSFVLLNFVRDYPRAVSTLFNRTVRLRVRLR